MAPTTARASSGRKRTENTSPSASFFASRGRPIFFAIEKTCCVQKRLDQRLLCVYKKSSLGFRGFAFAKTMAGTAAGESELTSSQPVVAGASHRESEMNADTFQAGSSGRQFRSLKIETTGDFYRG